MIGAIAGDIIGSVHENAGTKTKQFPLFVPESRFTDDTVLTIAVAESLADGGDLVNWLHEYYYRYPNVGYGGMFSEWARKRERTPYQSWGNGAAMRVSPVGFAFDSLDEVLHQAERTAAVTHNHPEAIRGVQATAAAIFFARSGADKGLIQRQIESRFGYDLSTPLAAIRYRYNFDVSARGSVPQAILSFLEAADFEDAVRNAISLGGDADTMAAIAGSIAEAYWGVPDEIAEETNLRLDDTIRDAVARLEQQL